MRAGGFAERRVIDLINHRFIAYYFNRSGKGEGGSAAAGKFVDGQTDNQYAYFAAFSPDGKIVGETELYADKDAVFVWLRGLLDENPQYDQVTETERLTLEAMGAERTPADVLWAAQRHEELGHYDLAAKDYGELAGSIEPAVRVPALLSLLRLKRYGAEWKAHAAVEASIRKLSDVPSPALLEVELEKGRRLLATDQVQGARALLQPLTRKMTEHPRGAEAHFYAGVACWFDDDRPWAKLHWCWIQENRPTDRLARRAYIAAAAEAMPYANPELKGYKAPVGNIGTGDIVRGYKAALRVYRDLLPLYEVGEHTGVPEPKQSTLSAGANPAAELVAKLRDGNDFVADNNVIVDQLVKIGEPALAPLMASVADDASPGQGYSGWALGLVLKSLEEPPAEAIAALRAATQSSDQYVSVLSKSGFSQIPRDVVEASASLGTALSDSPFLLVAGLQDGNASVPENNRRVARLSELGEASIAPLMAAMSDEKFPGRGYAGWALSQVLLDGGLENEAAVAALRRAAQDDDAYVSTLARSGVSKLGRISSDR